MNDFFSADTTSDSFNLNIGVMLHKEYKIKLILIVQDQDEGIDVDENGELVENLNVTTTIKPILTGIPQIDYVHDPNLPRELNGYNLSEYPFLNSVPVEIDFKCDGLHDGFYASVPHKCQVNRCEKEIQHVAKTVIFFLYRKRIVFQPREFVQVQLILPSEGIFTSRVTNK